MKIDFMQVVPSILFLLEGALVTLKYTVLSVAFGMVIGTGIAFSKLSTLAFFRWFGQAYASIFRGTPLLVQLMLIYFATPQLTGYKISAFEAGVLAFSLNSGAYVSEIIRAGILAVERGQLEAALSLGVGYTSAMRDIILPQAIKNILPALVNEVVNLLKESALVSVIGEMDLLRRAQVVSAEKYIYFEPLLVITVIYYLMVLVLSTFGSLLEKRLQRSD